MEPVARLQSLQVVLACLESLLSTASFLWRSLCDCFSSRGFVKPDVPRLFVPDFCPRNGENVTVGLLPPLFAIRSGQERSSERFSDRFYPDLCEIVEFRAVALDRPPTILGIGNIHVSSNKAPRTVAGFFRTLLVWFAPERDFLKFEFCFIRL